MSKYFRKPHSDESSTSDSASSDEEVDKSLTTSIDQLDISRGSETVEDSRGPFAHGQPAHSHAANVHQDALLHALLEERCMNEVIRDHVKRGARGKRPTDDDVQREARLRYQRLCARLAPLNLVSVGLEEDRHRPFRQKYRDGLDLLSRANLPSPDYQTALPTGLRRFVSGFDSQALVPHSVQSFHYNLEPVHSIPAFDSIVPSRYLRDFDEVGPLGKGGYGQVFSVRHRLDGCTYAIKKVPIRASILAQMQELEEMLTEVRALSRLDHPNVVRYFGSWIEWSTDKSSVSSPSPGMSFANSREANALQDAQDIGSFRSLRRVVTESDSRDEQLGFTFEASPNQQPSSAEPIPQASARDNAASNQSASPGALLSASEPTLALHIQMDVYPITLADYICPNPTGSLPPLAHCFHLEPSIRILLALLDGVEYLHSEGIVHRDLKPANIFLRVEQNPKSALGTAGTFSCSACHAHRQGYPTNLRVRIGDFGLVTHIARVSSLTSPSHSAVGTEIYRPMNAKSNVSPDLDVFALGIIACELLCRFNTQMERRETLHTLRNGSVPTSFQAFDGQHMAHMKDCILDMLSAGNPGSAEKETRIADLKERLCEILKTCVA